MCHLQAGLAPKAQLTSNLRNSSTKGYWQRSGKKEVSQQLHHKVRAS